MFLLLPTSVFHSIIVANLFYYSFLLVKGKNNLPCTAYRCGAFMPGKTIMCCINCFQSHHLGSFPKGLGSFPKGLGSFPRGLGSFPKSLGGFPRSLGSFPRSLGSFPRAWEVSQRAWKVSQGAWEVSHKAWEEYHKAPDGCITVCSTRE
jgi:hypothetical protein